MKTTKVPTDILEGMAKGLLTAPEAHLVTAVLFLAQTPSQYLGTIEALAKIMQVRFKQAYAMLKKAKKVGLIEMEAINSFPPTLYKITVLPPSQWNT